MTDEPNKAGERIHPMKRIVACIFCLLLFGCGATLPPPTSLAVLNALSLPTPTLVSEFEPTWRQPIIGKVVGVSDGDTITVLDDQKRQHKVRLDGIDAPDNNQDFGSRAKQSLSDLVFGKTVTVTSSKKDKYGRTLGKVTLDGKNINLEQVNRGMAWFYRFYAKELRPEDATAYDQAEASARKEKRGMWANGEPMPPWDYRRSGRPAKAPFWKTPTATAGAIIGIRSSKVYHLPGCPDYSKVSEKNRAPFAN
jgi:endonuclease YncB( thermonuclease family)